MAVMFLRFLKLSTFNVVKLPPRIYSICVANGKPSIGCCQFTHLTTTPTLYQIVSQVQFDGHDDMTDFI